MREWRRRLRQPLRLRRKIRMFFIEFVLQIRRGWLSRFRSGESAFQSYPPFPGVKRRDARLADCDEFNSCNRATKVGVECELPV